MKNSAISATICYTHIKEHEVETIHIHNEAIEGPLPSWFHEVGREEEVRVVYISKELIYLIASDQVSAFNIVSPTPIIGKGEILNDITRRELEAAHFAHIPTWFRNVPRDNPRAAAGIRADPLPVRMVFRNYITRDAWHEYRDTEGFSHGRPPSDWQEWLDFTAEPLFAPSAEDTNFNPADVEERTGIDPTLFAEMERMGRKLFKLGTARAIERGLVLIDATYKMGFTAVGNLVVIGEIHTPDSSQYVMADGFEEALRKGKKPQSLSTEFLREILIRRTGGDIDKAMELVAEPLPADVVQETLARYRELHRVFTGK